MYHARSNLPCSRCIHAQACKDWASEASPTPCMYYNIGTYVHGGHFRARARPVITDHESKILHAAKVVAVVKLEQ